MIKAPHKPIWHEGVLLTQQHFQQWNNYMEGLHNLQREQMPFAWGLKHLSVDESALLVGRFRIIQCQVIFANGQVVSFDASHDGELCCDLTKQEGSTLEIYLCLPLGRSVKNLNGYDEISADECGWFADYRNVKDEFDSAREHEVAFAKPNLYLSINASQENAASIKLAEVVMSGNNQYALAEDFIPAALCISAVSALKTFLESNINLLEAKINLLQDRKNNYAGNLAQFANTDLVHFLLLQTINRYLPILKCCHAAGGTHPMQVYLAFMQLIYDLDTFTQLNATSNFLPYQQSNLTKLFSVLQDQLLAALGQALPSNIQALNLKKKSEAICQVEDVDDRFLKNHDFYLVVKNSNEDMSWINRFIEQAKVSNIADLAYLVGSALLGIRLSHVQRLPNNLPLKSGCEYFRLERQGDFWKKIQEQKNIALFVSHEFNQAQFEMFVVKG